MNIKIFKNKKNTYKKKVKINMILNKMKNLTYLIKYKKIDKD